MPDSRPSHRVVAPSTPAAAADDLNQQLRSLGSRAHQLHAAARAADHFNARDTPDDRNTGSWLMSTALVLADEITAEVDGLARALRDRPADGGLQSTVTSVRVRAHQLHAAARAADHFLDQPGHEDRDTGSWLVATAVTLARQLAADIDDGASAPRRAVVDTAVIDPQDTSPVRRVGGSGAAPPLRGAA